VRLIFPAAAAAPEIGLAAAGDSTDAARSAVATLAELYAYPAVTRPAAPWVRASMVASMDGAASLGGRSGALSGRADRMVFSVLRSLADVILVGAGTASAERYRPVRDREVWAALRAGRSPTPPIAVVTGKLSLNADDPLLAGAGTGARTIVLTSQAAAATRRAAVARLADLVVAGRDEVSPAAAVAALGARGHQRILVEGGPTLLGEVAGAGLLDELCVTVSPVLAGGRAGRILAAPDAAGPGTAAWPGAVTGLRLAHVLEDDGFLLCRYLRTPRADGQAEAT